MQDFRKLVVWQRAHALALGVDRLMRDSRRHGGAELRKQLVRAADSIAANIAEGCGAASPREFARYLDIAIKSSSETEYHLILIGDRGLVPSKRCHSAIDEAVQVRRMLFGLRKRVLGEPVRSAPTLSQSTND